MESPLEVWERSCKEMTIHNEYVQSPKAIESGESTADGTIINKETLLRESNIKCKNDSHRDGVEKTP